MKAHPENVRINPQFVIFVGRKDEGLNGFLKPEIDAILEESQGQFCIYCHEPNANIKCSATSCQRRFHYTCGKKHGACFQYNCTKSFCDLDFPKSRHKLKLADDRICMAGCHESVSEDDSKSFISPCCQRIYHIG